MLEALAIVSDTSNIPRNFIGNGVCIYIVGMTGPRDHISTMIPQAMVSGIQVVLGLRSRMWDPYVSVSLGPLSYSFPAFNFPTSCFWLLPTLGAPMMTNFMAPFSPNTAKLYYTLDIAQNHRCDDNKSFLVYPRIVGESCHPSFGPRV